MSIYKLPIILLLVLFLSPTIEANVIYNSPPPVERVQPKQKKKTFHASMKKQKMKRLKSRKKPDQVAWDFGSGLFFGLAIAGFVALIVGLVLACSFFAPVGIILGLIIGGELVTFITTSIVLGAVLGSGEIFDFYLEDGEWPVFMIVFWVMEIVNLVFGIIFLIWGLVIGFPFMWGLGIALLIALLVFALLHFLIAMLGS